MLKWISLAAVTLAIKQYLQHILFHLIQGGRMFPNEGRYSQSSAVGVVLGESGLARQCQGKPENGDCFHGGLSKLLNAGGKKPRRYV